MHRTSLLLLVPLLLGVDRHEPDNSFTMASRARPASHLAGEGPLVLEHLTAEPGGEDWFHVHVDCCNDVGAEIRWAGARPLDLQLVDATGAAVTADAAGVQFTGAPGRRRIVVPGTGGSWFIRVSNPGARSVTYSLRALAPVYAR